MPETIEQMVAGRRLECVAPNPARELAVGESGLHDRISSITMGSQSWRLCSPELISVPGILAINRGSVP